MKKRITEEYGYYGFNDKEYHEKAEMLAKDILDKVYSKYNVYNEDFQIIRTSLTEPIIRKTCKIEYSNMCDWMNRIFILITEECLIKDQTEPDVAVISNSYTYSEENGKHITSKVEFKILDNRSHEILEPYIAFKDQVEKATIIVSVPDKSKFFDKEQLKYILLHEFGHIFDAFKKNVEFADMNYDLATLEFFGEDEKHPTPYDVKHFMNIVNNPQLSVDNLKKVIESATYPQVSMFFEQHIYLLNDSEMRQHLKNFRYELTQINRDEIFSNLRWVNELLEEKLLKVSRVFSIYWCAYRTMEFMQKYLPVEVKIKYANNDLKKVFSASNKSYPSGKYRRPYNVDFSVRREYNEKSFDQFIQFHMRRIYDIFLSNAATMAQDSAGWFTSKYSLKFGLTSQHYGNRLRESYDTNIKPKPILMW